MKKSLLYTLICLVLYSTLSGLEILAKPLVSYFSTSFNTYFIVYNVLLIIVNPIITKLIADKIYVSMNSKKPEDIEVQQSIEQ